MMFLIQLTMAKDPAFLFYPGDWLGGTIGMTFEEKGAYMELLMMQFTRGHMNERMIHQTVGQLWVNLKDKFEKDAEGLWFNSRLDVEKEKRKNYVDSRKNNKNGTNQHTSKPKKSKGHMTSHMEDVNINRNENKDFERGAGENFNEEREKQIVEATQVMMKDFKFTELSNPNKRRQISDFIRKLFAESRIEYFIQQYPAYWEYKKLSGLGTQSLDTFIGGGWDRENWAEKLKELQNAKSKSTNSDDRKESVAAVAKSADDYINSRLSANG